jgi:phosphate transport system substrate-binding protein
VQGVSGDPNALGYFGFAYYENNQDTLKALAVDGVKPNTHTIHSAEYPLSRPLFIYVSTQALKENKAVEPFVNFYLDNLDEYVEQAKYVTLPSSLEQESRKQWEDRTTGTVFTDEGEPKGGDLEAALKQSQ